MVNKQIFLLSSFLVFIFCSFNLSATGNNGRAMKFVPGSEIKTIEWQKELRSKMFSLLNLKDLVTSDVSIPFNARLISSAKKKNYILKELEISSTNNRRVRVILTVPSSLNKSCPAVVCVHGHGHNRYIVHETGNIYKGFASVLAENGYITISADVGQHEVFEEGRTLMGERLWDLMRCVDYLVSMPEVDNSKIGCAGLSLGGEMTMWLGAMDVRVSAVISSGFLTKMDQLEVNHCMCWKFEGLRELADFPDIYSMIAPRPLMAQNGLKEPVSQFPVNLALKALEEIKPSYKAFNMTKNLALQVHPGGHEIDLPSLLAFFDRHLHMQ